MDNPHVSTLVELSSFSQGSGVSIKESSLFDLGLLKSLRRLVLIKILK